MAENTVDPAAFSALQEQVLALAAGHQTLSEENAALREQLSQVAPGAKSAKPTPPPLPTDTFKVSGDPKSYRFVTRQFRVGDDKVTAVDALADKALLAHLVKIGSGVIAEVA